MTTVRYRGVRDPRAAGPGQVWVEEIGTGMPGEEVQVRGLDPRYDLGRHSPTGYGWGFAGSGPAQLALALLADALADDEIAQALYQEFKREFVSGWQDRWQVDRQTLRLWAAGRWAARQEHERWLAEPVARRPLPEEEEALAEWREDLDDQAVSDRRARPFGEGGPHAPG